MNERLAWIPWYLDARGISPPAELKDFEQGWFWNLLFASMRAEWQGYLPMSSNLWTIAGAKRRDFWDANKSGTLACFEVREMEDGKKLLFYPPLVSLIQEQGKKLKGKRRLIPDEISETSTDVHRGCGNLSFSFSDSSSEKNHKLKSSSVRARPPARDPCPRCSGTGLRASDFTPGRRVECECRHRNASGAKESA